MGNIDQDHIDVNDPLIGRLPFINVNREQQNHSVVISNPYFFLFGKQI